MPPVQATKAFRFCLPSGRSWVSRLSCVAPCSLLMCSLLEIRATRGVISVVLRDVRSMLMSESQMCTVFLLRRYLDASMDASQSTLNLTLIVAPAGSPEVLRILESTAMLYMCGGPPAPGGSSTSVARPVRPHTSALTLTPAGSSFPRHCAPAQALKSSCLLLLEKAQSSCGWACSCMRDANRPTPRS